jgi:metal-dependent amidase/aminoacylase/carboxypeptidase family protein
MKDRIQQLVSRYSSDFINIRHHLHAHPELSYKEFETSKFVQGQLKQLGIPFKVMAETGVVGLIKGKKPDKRVIALRADMDALPIREENDVPYKSRNEGVMHAASHIRSSCTSGPGDGEA